MPIFSMVNHEKNPLIKTHEPIFRHLTATDKIMLTQLTDKRKGLNNGSGQIKKCGIKNKKHTHTHVHRPP